jgi:hypothetical protein
MEDAARTLALGDEPDLDAIVRLQGLLGRARLELTIVAKALDLAIHQLGAAERAARDELAAAARGRGLIVRGVR